MRKEKAQRNQQQSIHWPVLLSVQRVVYLCLDSVAAVV